MTSVKRRVRGFYERGKKRCIKCKIWYDKEAAQVLCKDCHGMLRTKPHSSNGRRRYAKINPPVRY